MPFKPPDELDSILSSSEKDSPPGLLDAICGKGPAGPGFKETSLERITRFAASAKRKMRVAINTLECDAMTVVFADVLRCVRMTGEIGLPLNETENGIFYHKKGITEGT